MDLNIITETFVVVVIGGMGSIFGAFLAALLIGQTHAFGIMLFPSLTLVMTFALMAIVLIVRPLGFLGREEKPQRISGAEVAVLREGSRGATIAGSILVALLLVAPLVVNDYGQIILSEIFLLAVFAASLHMLMSIGGMVSFGHAAFFGMGAYAAAWMATQLGASMTAAVALGIVISAFVAVVIGWFCTRLRGVYLAFLTLAFAQILWAVAVQWVSLTGGDNGILGVHPPEWLISSFNFYYFALALSAIALASLRSLIFSPFGYTLRAARDSAIRAESTGVNVRVFRLTAFTISGMFSGLAGTLIAFQRGRVFPNDISISTSVDVLVMVLVGGIQTVTGPIFGAAAYHLMRTELIRNFADHWRLILGIVIVLLVVSFPSGIVGGINRLLAMRSVKRPA